MNGNEWNVVAAFELKTFFDRACLQALFPRLHWYLWFASLNKEKPQIRPSKLSACFEADRAHQDIGSGSTLEGKAGEYTKLSAEEPKRAESLAALDPELHWTFFLEKSCSCRVELMQFSQEWTAAAAWVSCHIIGPKFKQVIVSPSTSASEEFPFAWFSFVLYNLRPRGLKVPYLS